MEKSAKSHCASQTVPDTLPNLSSQDADFEDLLYLDGFGNHLQSEALPGALPVGQNSPRVCPYGLYAEQISGTAFTAPRKENYRSWQYRIRPSVTHEPFRPCSYTTNNLTADFLDKESTVATPNQLRWKPAPIPEGHVDWLQGMFTICGTGSPSSKTGFAVHMYTASSSMDHVAFANADGDFLMVPQLGRLWLTTEFGRMQVSPGEIAVVQQGIRFSVQLPDGPSRGYVCEVFGGHYQLPELGPIGANGLASPRDFQMPVAWFEQPASSFASEQVQTREETSASPGISESTNEPPSVGPETRKRDGDSISASGGSESGFLLVHKYDGLLFEARQDFSPFNVVAWHGNYVPFKYDLSRFCPMNAVAFDHPDPSIFTVLTCPTSRPGVAAVDFVLFPPRWTVAEHTFRPPYFHRNCMSEFMGLIRGEYEAKAEGFLPGGASLHSCMTPHGPDAETFEKATAEEVEEGKPEKLPSSTLAFMFESCFTPRVTKAALASTTVDVDYYKCWKGLKSHFHLPSSMKA